MDLKDERRGGAAARATPIITTVNEGSTGVRVEIRNALKVNVVRLVFSEYGSSVSLVTDKEEIKVKGLTVTPDGLYIPARSLK